MISDFSVIIGTFHFIMQILFISVISKHISLFGLYMFTTPSARHCSNTVIHYAQFADRKTFHLPRSSITNNDLCFSLGSLTKTPIWNRLKIVNSHKYQGASNNKPDGWVGEPPLYSGSKFIAGAFLDLVGSLSLFPSIWLSHAGSPSSSFLVLQSLTFTFITISLHWATYIVIFPIF